MRSSLMMSLLRILTPEEINELTTTSEGNKRVPLTQLMYHKMGVKTGEELESASLAKILPFTFPESKSAHSDEEGDDTVPNQDSGPTDELLAEVHKSEQIVSQDESSQHTHNEEENQGKLATSVFILHEKKRFEASVHKMRSKELLQNYRKNAAVDIEQERGLRDDMKKSSRTGVLINKKHA